MDEQSLLTVLQSNYDVNIQTVEKFREGGNVTYIVHGARQKYFLKVIRPPFLKDAIRTIDIQVYLLQKQFPVIPIVRTKAGDPYLRTGEPDAESISVLYDFIEGDEPAPEDTERVGALIGNLHRLMCAYPGSLPVRDRHFFIDRYLAFIKKVRYPQRDFFLDYGAELWERVKPLPRGYSHCDLYCGNIHAARDGSLYVIDFDTSCSAFPVYDAVLFCREIDYFRFSDDGRAKSLRKLERFVAGYTQYASFTPAEIAAFDDMMAIYHFQLQAQIFDLFGYGDDLFDFLDRQREWLNRWREQSGAMRRKQ